jgi:endonuclease/exonuclease/phosphatase family metal-dependent hydrolase
VAAGALIASATTAPALAAGPAGGYLNVHLSVTKKNEIKVSWKVPGPLIKYYKVQTSTSRKMNSDLKTVRVSAKKHTLVVPHAKLATRASGDYTFVKVIAFRGDGGKGGSVTKWVMLHPVTPPKTGEKVTLGTYNVRTWRGEEGEPAAYLWDNRKTRVASTIESSGADVVAIQEAGGSNNDASHGGIWQWQDLMRSLPAKWSINDNEAYRTDYTKYHNVYGKQGTRIIFNSDKYKMVDHGFIIPPYLTKDKTRWVPWVKLEDRTTGTKFYFMSIHFEDGKNGKKLYNIRNKQAAAVIKEAKKFGEDGTPVYVAGDTNSTIYSTPNNGVKRKFVKAGFYDAFSTKTITDRKYPTTNDFVFPVVASPQRRDDILSMNVPEGSYFYHNLAYKSASKVASDHFMQVAQLPL